MRANLLRDIGKPEAGRHRTRSHLISIRVYSSLHGRFMLRPKDLTKLNLHILSRTFGLEGRNCAALTSFAFVFKHTSLRQKDADRRQYGEASSK